MLATSRPAAAADSSTSWPSKKKKKKHHKSAKPAKATGTASGGAAAAAASDDDADEGGDDKDDADDKAEAPKPKAKPKAEASDDDDKGDKADKGRKDDDEREASDGKRGGGDDDDEGGAPVVRRKAKRPVIVDEGGPAPIALEASVGPRGVHRTFTFNDPLSAHVTGAVQPYGYKLALAPEPFVDLGLYPAAFSSRGAAASFGIVAHYEKLIGTKTTDANGMTVDTTGQQLEIGVRARLPLGEHEAGLTASYGQQSFNATPNDPGPANGSTVPNVDYQFAALEVDGRLALSPVELGAHVGTRFVFKTGDLAKEWFSTTKTNSIDVGAWVAYKITPVFSVVGGVDFLRYGFDFNPVNTNSYFVAGGAVDQYISGFLALRVTVSGS
jgi:hypothetical protein